MPTTTLAPTEPLDAAAFDPLRIAGSEVESYRTFDEMAASADHVVVERWTAFAPGRVMFYDDGSNSPIRYVDGTFAVDRYLRGTGEETRVVEFLSTAMSEEQLLGAVDQLSGAVGSGTTVLFLRDKGGDEADLLRLVNSRGMVTSTKRAAVDLPLGEIYAVAPDHLRETMDPSLYWDSIDDFIDDLGES